ncbi:hypothetical protein SAMD00079811_01340 [Scytonema sp. HK-05]|nr:hypothetical protein SAMD00079811_01340 [Scytonema sp. HK-05]
MLRLYTHGIVTNNPELNYIGIGCILTLFTKLKTTP